MSAHCFKIMSAQCLLLGIYHKLYIGVSFLGVGLDISDNLRDGGRIITKTLPKYLLFTLFPVCVYPVNVPAFCRIL